MITTSTVSIAVGTSPPIVIPWTSGMNAHDALETAYNQIKDGTKFSFAVQFYGTYQGAPNGPLGYMVMMLNGIFDLPDSQKYWAFYVNGAMAPKGVDYTVLNPGDGIGFVNESYHAEKHRGTQMEIKNLHYAALRAQQTHDTASV